jgi:uncharacterized membrane protein YsdA (DUF1294 family)
MSASVFADQLPLVLLLLCAAASVCAFIAYALDKSAARNNRWRVPERALHILALMGGWPGALAAQQLFRHKSRKRSFQLVFWATVFVHCGLVAWILAMPL